MSPARAMAGAAVKSVANRRATVAVTNSVGVVDLAALPISGGTVDLTGRWIKLRPTGDMAMIRGSAVDSGLTLANGVPLASGEAEDYYVVEGETMLSTIAGGSISLYVLYPSELVIV